MPLNFSFFLFLCGLVLPMFYASCFIVLLPFPVCMWLCFANVMPFYLIFFSFLLRLCLGFANVLYLFIIFFSFLLCLCSANVLCLFIYIVFLFFSACALVLPIFYTFLLYFSFLLCLSFGFANVLCLFIIFFLFMRLFLGFVNVLCLFIYIFLFYCGCGSISPMFYASSFIFFFSLLPEPWFCQCSIIFYYIFSFLLCLWLGFANPLCLFIYIFIYFR